MTQEENVLQTIMKFNELVKKAKDIIQNINDIIEVKNEAEQERSDAFEQGKDIYRSVVNSPYVEVRYYQESHPYRDDVKITHSAYYLCDLFIARDAGDELLAFMKEDLSKMSKETLVEKLKDKLKKDISSIEEKNEQIEKQLGEKRDTLAQLNEQLAGVPWFSFAKRAELKKSIDELEKEISSLEKEMSNNNQEIIDIESKMNSEEYIKEGLRQVKEIIEKMEQYSQTMIVRKNALEKESQCKRKIDWLNEQLETIKNEKKELIDSLCMNLENVDVLTAIIENPDFDEKIREAAWLLSGQIEHARNKEPKNNIKK